MTLKQQKENRCPSCGRVDTAHRVRRSWFLRWFRPNSALMKCRLCLTYFFVSKPPPEA